jgi:hypothetical protein
VTAILSSTMSAQARPSVRYVMAVAAIATLVVVLGGSVQASRTASARVCSDSRDPKIANRCPKPPLSPALSATPVRNLYQLVRVSLQISHGLIYGASLRFTAPYPVTSVREDYVIESIFPPGCHGPLGAIVQQRVDRAVAHGSTVREYMPYVFVNTCGRSQRIDVMFYRAPGPVAPKAALRAALQVRIGTITVHEPAGTRSALPPVPHHST